MGLLIGYTILLAISLWLYYLAMGDLITRNGLITENHILENIRQEDVDEIDVVLNSGTNRSGPVRRNLTNIMKVARVNELFYHYQSLG